jgi:hypothetical protein
MNLVYNVIIRGNSIGDEGVKDLGEGLKELKSI